jgi:predicted nuclease of predicted toxin-antitoxin system
MIFKLDENFGRSIQQLIREKGHDCKTVREEGLLGSPASQVLEAAVAEQRILVTMDHDFGNVFAYPPERAFGIAVINPPSRSSLDLIRWLVLALLEALKNREIYRRLWIIEPGRIREHESTE